MVVSLRRNPRTAMEAIRKAEALIDEISTGIVRELRELGGRAVGLHRVTMPVLFGERLTLDGDDGEPIDLGHVGQVTRVDADQILSFCAGGVVPVVPSLALDEST